MTDHLYHPVERSQLLMMHYVCATCWGHLREFFNGTDVAERRSKVFCGSCGDETRGYVTKSYVEQRRQDDAQRYAEARSALIKIGVIEKPPSRSAEEILDELGVKKNGN